MLSKKAQELGEQPAFPEHYSIGTGAQKGIACYSGLTKREYFAGLALQGSLANSLNTSADSVLIYVDDLLEELVKDLND